MSKILFLEEIRQVNILVEQGKKKIKKKKNLKIIFLLLILLKIFFKKTINQIKYKLN
jgi:hypothetical protein